MCGQTDGHAAGGLLPGEASDLGGAEDPLRAEWGKGVVLLCQPHEVRGSHPGLLARLVAAGVAGLQPQRWVALFTSQVKLVARSPGAMGAPEHQAQPPAPLTVPIQKQQQPRDLPAAGSNCSPARLEGSRCRSP